MSPIDQRRVIKSSNNTTLHELVLSAQKTNSRLKDEDEWIELKSEEEEEGRFNPEKGETFLTEILVAFIQMFDVANSAVSATSQIRWVPLITRSVTTSTSVSQKRTLHIDINVKKARLQ